MKRSVVNNEIREAKKLLDKFHWSLPEWAYWSLDDYKTSPTLAVKLYQKQMGWDVTDFGSGDFDNRGLTLFCVRNGIQWDPNSLPYAEKLLFVRENQVTPFHLHKVKLEDIINRAGGNLVIEFCHPNVDNKSTIGVEVDAKALELAPFEKLILRPGQSVTIPREIYHRFYGEVGKGTVLVGEVSQVNDDQGDNYFLEELGRFSQIEEDETAEHPLWNEVATS